MTTNKEKQLTWIVQDQPLFNKAEHLSTINTHIRNLRPAKGKKVPSSQISRKSEARPIALKSPTETNCASKIPVPSIIGSRNPTCEHLENACVDSSRLGTGHAHRWFLGKIGQTDSSNSPSERRRHHHIAKIKPLSGVHTSWQPDVSRNTTMQDLCHYCKINTYLNSSLDPFYVPAIPLSSTEKCSLLHYLSVVPGMTWGVRPDGLCNPVREVTIEWMQRYPLAARWGVIMAEILYAARKGQPWSESITSRKAEAYSALNEALRNPEQQASDNTAYGIVLAALAEGRFSSPQVTRVHLRGVAAVTAKRGGPSGRADQSLALLILSLPCDSGPVDSEDEKHLKASVLDKLSLMQRHNADLIRHILSAMAHCTTATGTSTSYDRATVEYASALQQLMKDKVTHYLIQPRTSYATTPAMRVDFAFLYGLNLMVMYFASMPELGKRYLLRLLHYAQTSSAFDKDGNALIKPIAMIWSMKLVLVEMYEAIDPEVVNVKEAWLCMSCVDALKVFSLMNQGQRWKLMGLLHGLLVNLASPLTIESDSYGVLEAELSADELGLSWRLP